MELETSQEQRTLLWNREDLLETFHQLDADDLDGLLSAIDRLAGANGNEATLTAAMDAAGPGLCDMAYTLAWCHLKNRWPARLRHWLMYEWPRVRKQIKNGEPVKDVY